MRSMLVGFTLSTKRMLGSTVHISVHKVGSQVHFITQFQNHYFEKIEFTTANEPKMATHWKRNKNGKPA